MKEEKFDELVDNITSFIYDWDPYEFKDIYQDYEMGLEDTRECLSSKRKTEDIIYNIENIFYYEISCKSYHNFSKIKDLLNDIEINEGGNEEDDDKIPEEERKKKVNDAKASSCILI